MSKIEEVRQKKEREEALEATWDSYRAALESVFAMQEETLRFARSLIEDSAQTIGDQAESNRAIARMLAKHSRRQRETVEAMLEASATAYADLVYVPFHRYLQTLQALVPTTASETAPEDGSRRPGERSLPIADYDSLNVSEVSKQIERNGLSVEDLKKLKSYEQTHKDRQSVVELLDRSIEETPSHA